MDREMIDRWCERGILALVLGMIWFSVLATGAVRMLEFIIVQVFALAILVLWIIRLFVRTDHRILWPPICWFVLLFVGLAIQGYGQAAVEYPARDELIKVIVYAFIFMAVLDNLNRQEASQWIIYGLIALGCLISIYALYQFITGSDRVWHFIRPSGYKGRGSGTFICPNHLAGYLEMVLPLGLAYTLTSRLKATPKVFIGYASIMIAIGIGVSLSRAGWVSAAFSIALFFLLMMRYPGYRIPAILVLAAMIGGGFLFAKKAYLPKKRTGELFQSQNFNDTRSQLGKAAVKIWQDHFWIGAGPAQFDDAFRAYRPPDIQMRPIYVHNDYLNTLVDYGIVGLSVVVLGVTALFVGVIGSWKFLWRSSDLGSKPSNRAALVLGAMLGLTALLVHSGFDFNMHIPSNALVAVILMALIAGHLRYATERYWVKFGWLGKAVAIPVILAAIGFLGFEGGHRFREYAALSHAERFNARPLEAVPDLKAAWAIEPQNPETPARIGEILRRQSWEGWPGYEAIAQEAIMWYDRGIAANPLNPDNYMFKGMCLDWLGQHDAARTWFRQALERDPNNYYVVQHMGWHFFQAGDMLRAKIWFDRSMQIWNHEVARFYLERIRQRLAESTQKSA